MEPSKEQILAMTLRDRTLLVSAGAGAGKTHTLTERIIQSLCRENAPASLSRLLVVTFTRAAARELRDRISDALCKALAEHPENTHLAEQLLLLPSAPIRTIDSFCIDLARRNADLLGLSPSFRPAEKAELGLCFRSVMEEVLNEGYEGALGYGGESVSREDFEELVHALSSARSEEDLPEVLEKLYDKLQSFPQRCGLLLSVADRMEEAASSPLENPWTDTLVSYAKEALTEAHAALAHYDGEVAEGPGEEKFHLLAREFLQALLAAKNAEGYEALREALGAFTPAEGFPKAYQKELADKAAVDALKKAYAEAAAIFTDTATECLYTPEELSFVLGQTARLHRTLGLLLSAFHERFFAKKKQLGILDFSDTKQLAFALLYNKDGSRTDVAASLQKSYDEIYIDEYQDVNAVEHAIFEAISTPKNRFMVGDIKQSIYRFRGGDPEIFARLKSEYPALDPEDPKALGKKGDTACLFLSRNYRSDTPILSYTNAVFQTVFSVARDSIGYVSDDDLIPGKEDADRNAVLPTHGFFYRDSSVKEIDFLVSEIGRLTSGERKKKADKRPDGEPPREEDFRIKPKDITLLCATNDAARALATKLEHRGISAVLSDDASFFFNPEIQLAVALLNVISNPQRDTYLAGVLCSPLYRFSLDEAVRMRRAHPKGPLLHAVRAWAQREEEGARAREFLADLEGFRLQAEGLSADRFLRILYKKTGLLAMAGKNGRGRDNLLLLYNFARQFESTSFRGLYRFIRYVNEIIRTGAQFTAPSSTDGDNAVRVMTIHKSKGLQAPAVFLTHVTTHKKKEGFSVTDLHPLLGLPLQPRDPSGLVPLNTPICHAIRHESYRKGREESMRLLYVALTRAAERLYVTGDLVGNYGFRDAHVAYLKSRLLLGKLTPYLLCHTTWFDWIHLTVPDRLLAEPVLPAQPVKEADVAPTAAVTAPPPALPAEELRSALRERFDWQYPHLAVTKTPGKLSVSLLHPDALSLEDGVVVPAARGEESAPPAVPRFLSHTDLHRAAKAGTATHLFMQFCQYARLAENGAAAEVEQLKKDGFLTPEDAALVNVEEAERFARSPFPARLASADLVRREFRFHMPLPAGKIADLSAQGVLGDETVLVQGVIDCLIHVGDEIYLIDYKTDRLTPTELADPRLAAKKLWDAHGIQMGYYAAAVRYIFGKYPSRCMLYSLPLGDATEKTVKECLQYAGLLEEETNEA